MNLNLMTSEAPIQLEVLLFRLSEHNKRLVLESEAFKAAFNWLHPNGTHGTMSRIEFPANDNELLEKANNIAGIRCVPFVVTDDSEGRETLIDKLSQIAPSTILLSFYDDLSDIAHLIKNPANRLFKLWLAAMRGDLPSPFQQPKDQVLIQVFDCAFAKYLNEIKVEWELGLTSFNVDDLIFDATKQEWRSQVWPSLILKKENNRYVLCGPIPDRRFDILVDGEVFEIGQTEELDELFRKYLPPNTLNSRKASTVRSRLSERVKESIDLFFDITRNSVTNSMFSYAASTSNTYTSTKQGLTVQFTQNPKENLVTFTLSFTQDCELKKFEQLTLFFSKKADNNRQSVESPMFRRRNWSLTYKSEQRIQFVDNKNSFEFELKNRLDPEQWELVIRREEH